MPTLSDNLVATLAVSIREMPAVHVAYLDCQVDAEQDYFPKIHASFQRVQAWVRERGYDPYTVLNVGTLYAADGPLSSYGCCVQVPEEVQNGSEGVGIQELPGGQYAVVSITKDPAIIGDAIGRFYREYVPQNKLEIDGTRPTYEIYYERTMEYCVPVRGGL
jgi:DNA gyrase inhibitor GyrI